MRTGIYSPFLKRSPFYRRRRTTIVGIVTPPVETTNHLWSSLDGPLWQLSDGTTAVSLNNDPVGYWGDTVSNFHLIQATSGNRPLYQTPDVGLSFDGTNDHLFYSGSIDDTSGSIAFLFKTGATIFRDRNYQVLFSSCDGYNWFEIGITPLGQLYLESNWNGTKHTVLGSTILQNSTDYFVSVTFDDVGYTIFVNDDEQNPLVIENEGTPAWFGDVYGDNIVVGGTVTSSGLVRPFQGIMREIAVYNTEII